MGKKELRSEKLLRNAAWSIIGYLAYAIVGFISRSLFIHQLGEDLSGVATLYTNILKLLSMAELGFSGAISIHLYKPIADGNEQKIAALMNLYRKAYQVIAVVIFALGMLMLPFVPLIVKTDAAIPHLRWYFFLYVLWTSLTYCFAYRDALITAYQEDYRRLNITNGILIAVTIVQIALLYWTANYTLYLTAAILGTLLTNLLIYRKAGTLYPYLKKYKDEKVTAEDRKSIFAFIKAESVNKISISIKTATDSVIVSAFVDVVMTGIVGNYMLVLGTLEKLLGFFFLNCTPAVGNMVATTDKDSQYNTFLDLEFIAFWIYGFLSAGMLCVLTPFVRDIWIRQENLVLGFPTLFLLILNFFLTGTNYPAAIFFGVRGLIRKMPYINVLNLLVNLVVSLGLVTWLGVNGVYIGTVMSLVLTSLPLTHYLVLRHHFDGNCRPYLRLYLYYLAVTVIGCGVCIGVCHFLPPAGLIGIVVKILACTAVYNAIFLLASFRTREFKSIFTLVRKILKR